MTEASDPAALRREAVAQTLGYRFRDTALLTQACTHTSRCGAQASAAVKRRDANERLEFLGDALLGGALCLLLFQRFPDADEGPLSRLKSRLVSRHTLARAIEDTPLLPLCSVGSQMGSTWPDSIKANLCEGILAAIYLEGGWDALVTAVERLLGSRIEDPDSGAEDARMRLQTWCLEFHKRLPTYTCERSGGSDHEPEFTATATIADHSASGTGSSRRRAEAAAADALMAVLKPADSATTP
jgi:ribonuclease-3